MDELTEPEGQYMKRAENLYPGDRVKVWGPDLEVKSAQPFGPTETVMVNGFLQRGPGTLVTFLDGDQTFDAFYPPGVPVEFETGIPSVVDEPQPEPEPPAQSLSRASGGLLGQAQRELQDNPPPPSDTPTPDPGERVQGGLLDLGSRVVPAHAPDTSPSDGTPDLWRRDQ